MAVSYQVFRDTSSSGSFAQQVYDGDSVSFVDSGLSGGTTYYYEVQATNANGSSAKSPPQSGTTLKGPPATPTGLTVGGATLTSLTVSWNVSRGATSYQVFRDISASGSFSTTAYDGSGLSFMDTGLSSNTTYYYIVCASNAKGSSSTSGPQAGTTLASPPPQTPTGLTVGNPAITTLDVSWNESSGATGYQVFRDTSANGSFGTMVYNGSALSFMDTGLIGNTTYYYVVQAVNDGGPSAGSSAQSGTTLPYPPPATPTGLTVTNPTFTSLTVSWSASAGATSYQVFRDITAGGDITTSAYSGSLLSFVDGKLASGATYFYTVCAINVNSPSASSDPVSGTVLLSAIMSIPYSGSFTYSVDLGGTPKDVYFVFSNPASAAADSQPQVSGSSLSRGPSVSRAASSAPSAHGIGLKDRLAITPFLANPFNYIQPTRISPKSIKPPKPSFDVEGDTTSFHDQFGSTAPIPATCRMVVSSIAVSSGSPRTLNIWVSDDCWSGNPQPTKDHTITSNMITAIAKSFLRAGADNDIYDWVTNIFGQEYGPTEYSNLISPNNEITILLYDIDGDNSTDGGTLGYFWAGDLFDDPVYVPKSNKRVMFYLDAVLLATPDDQQIWTPSAYWPSEMISTLAHEFQHMIHFFQKTIWLAYGDSTDTWIDEMSSMVTEDLVADKIKVSGPRGVAYNEPTAGSIGNHEGRLPGYNGHNSLSLTTWNYNWPDVLYSYAIAYAFGAYLARDFGGAQFFKDIVLNSYTDSRAIDYALSKAETSETFSSVFQKWGAANLLSDNPNASPGYQYNSGTWFTSTIGSTSYNLGSIDLFNFDPTPAIWLTSPVGGGSQYKTSNILFNAGIGLTGLQSWQIQLPTVSQSYPPGNVILTVVLK